MQNGARIPKLLSERVLYAHWKGVVYSLKGCCFHIFYISKPFCHYNSGIVCHAEQQVAINPTYSNLFIYFDSIISIIFVDVSENMGYVHLTDQITA